MIFSRSAELRHAQAVPTDGWFDKSPHGGDEGRAISAMRGALSLRFNDFEIDIARHELRRGGAIVHIEPQVFDLIVHLIRNRERTVSKDELIDAIWDGRIVSEATLSSRISAARRALGDSGNDQSLIRTLYKRGFRFVGEVEEGAASSPAAAIAEPAAPDGFAHGGAAPQADGDALLLLDERATPPLYDPCLALGLQSSRDLAAVAASPEPAAADQTKAGAAPSRSEQAPVQARRWAKGGGLAAAVIGAASVLAAAVWLTMPTSPVKESLTKEADAPSGQLAALPASIIVLPFANLGGDAKQDYLADGITDSLISDLVRALPGISMVSRDTAFTYKDRGTDAREIGRELDVRYLLAGSIVPDKERVRVNVRLVETREGNQLWAERFDTEQRSILQVQDEIVSRVARAIGLKVVEAEARRSRRERPSSPELTDLVLRGKAVLNLPSSPATMIEARGLFEQALRLQPTDVDALAGVASTHVFEFLNGYYETEGDQRLKKAELLLDQAVAIEPRHLMVLKARAALRRAQGKFDDAIATAQAVIMENPAEPWAYKEIGLSTLYMGRADEALGWFAKADRIGPRDPGRWTWLDGQGHALILLGRDEEAVHALISALDANPGNVSSHAFLAAAYALLNRSDEARASLAIYLQRRPGTRVSTFRRLSPVPLELTSAKYREQHERLAEGLRKAGMPE
jgi:TolB-like protein/DNA-binding winged helix-turn-helix (wHTH) protein